MVDFFRQLFEGVTDAWKRLTINARVQIGLAAFLTLVVLGAIVIVGSQPQYVRLHSRLDVAESDQITAWLTSNNIRWQLTDGGQTVMVPRQDRQTALVGLAGQNLPLSQGLSQGFELFDTTELMTNQWLQNVEFMRAVKGEAERQLNVLDFVNTSHVFIREAADQLFVSDQTPSEAVVTLNTTRKLTRGEIKAIVHTISSYGGHNLNEKNITLMLADGQLLHSPDGEEFAALASNRFGTEVERVEYAEKKINDALRKANMYGIVTVSANFDWTSEEKSETTNTLGTPLSEMVTSTSSTTGEGPPGGAAGLSANIPGGAGGGASTLTETTSEEVVTNNSPNTTVTVTQRKPGDTKTLTASAMVAKLQAPADGSTDPPQYVPIEAAEVTAVGQLIATAIGAPVTNVTVSPLNYAPVDLAGIVPISTDLAVSLLDRGWVRFATNIALIIMALVAVRILMKRVMVLPTTVEEEIIEIPEATKEDLRRKEIAAEVERLSMEEPETVAALLRSWTAEDD